jgi:hypothetical protein
VAAGGVLLGLGLIALGSAAAMVAGGFVYSGARGRKRTDGEEEGGHEPARAPVAGRPRTDSGVKVRVPKGSTTPVTRFRDDGLPPGGSP